MDVRWLVVQLVVSAALAGLCWTVQLAVYPQFARVLAAAGAEGFRGYHADYTRGMGFVAGPLMLIELGLAVLWVVHGAEPGAAGAGAALVAVLWALTFGVMVPLHRALQIAPTEARARWLATLNWLRTAAWSARAGLLAAVLAGAGA